MGIEKNQSNYLVFRDKLYWITALAIFAALILSIISFLGLCSEECAEGHNYTLFGFTFEMFGISFFIIIALLHALQRSYSTLKFWEAVLFAGALGAELMFIVIQKYYIGKWCPVCLGIALCIAIGAISLGIRDLSLINRFKNNTNQGVNMSSTFKRASFTFAIFIGFFSAFMGVTKSDTLQASENIIKEKLAFGRTNSNIEVYLFTDWACPACRKLESKLEPISKIIMSQAKLVFVDHVIHPETLNYAPFHLSFIINNKNNYFKLRSLLSNLSKETGEPSDEQIAKLASSIGVHYDEINYSDIAFGIKYNKMLGEKFKILGTPTMVIINTESKKGKKLSGNSEITESNVQNAINALKNG